MLGTNPDYAQILKPPRTQGSHLRNGLITALEKPRVDSRTERADNVLFSDESL